MSEQSPLSLGTEDIKKLLMRYAVPAIVAMTAASLYNMMDSIFIGHGVGALGIAGLAVTFPFINLAAAFGSLVGVGASTLVSVKMGQKDLKSAEAVLGNVLLLNTVIGFLFMTVCLIFLDPILYFFGASADTLPYARDYMKVILYGNLITHIYMGLNEGFGLPAKGDDGDVVCRLDQRSAECTFHFCFGYGNQGSCPGDDLCPVFGFARGVVPFFQSEKFYSFSKRNFQGQMAYCRRNAGYRVVAFPDESL